jgi:hypothetical protein
MSRRTKYVILFVLLAVLVNLPLLRGLATDRGVSAALVIGTAVGDLILAFGFLLTGRSDGLRRPSLRAIAMDDVLPSESGHLLERVEGELYLMRGEVTELDDGELVLELGNRSVEVLLDGHRNLVDLHQFAQVRARLVG